MDDVHAKVDQEETNEVDQSEQEKVNNTEEDNAAVEVAVNAEVGEQNNDANKNADDANGDLWELDDINEMQMATESFGGHYNVRGGWGEWKQDGEETWREWEFYPTYQENDWVIDDLWVFDDDRPTNQANNGGACKP